MELSFIAGGDHDLVLTMYKTMGQFMNLGKLGVRDVTELYNREKYHNHNIDYPPIIREKRSKLSGGPGVMYVSLDNSGGESCPTTADSSAVSLSQMAFLSMAVSIFSTVANIANNINNNNNNQNDNNINFVHQQNNNLNMNQNLSLIHI